MALYQSYELHDEFACRWEFPARFSAEDESAVTFLGEPELPPQHGGDTGKLAATTVSIFLIFPQSDVG